MRVSTSTSSPQIFSPSPQHSASSSLPLLPPGDPAQVSSFSILFALPFSEKHAVCEETDAGWCFRGSGACVEDEHFIVWMRTAGLPTFRKLYARIQTPLPAGTYTVRISNGRRYNSSGHDFYYNPSESAAYYEDSSILPKNQSFLYPVHSFGGTKAIVLSTTSWIGGKNGECNTKYLSPASLDARVNNCVHSQLSLLPLISSLASYVSSLPPASLRNRNSFRDELRQTGKDIGDST